MYVSLVHVISGLTTWYLITNQSLVAGEDELFLRGHWSCNSLSMSGFLFHIGMTVGVILPSSLIGSHTVPVSWNYHI